MRRVVKGEGGVDERRGEVAAALASLDDHLGNIRERLHHLLALADVHEADGRRHDAARPRLPATDQGAQLHQRRGGVPKGKECVGMFLYGHADAGLCAGDALLGRHLHGAFVSEVALGLDAHALQRALTDAGRHHRHVSHDRPRAPRAESLVHLSHGARIGPDQAFHVEVGRRVDGVQHRPLAVERDVGVLQLTLDGAEALDHNPLPHIDALLAFHLAIVSARRDEGVTYGVRLRVADQHDREHVRLLGVKVGQRGEGRRLAVSPSLPHDSHRRLRCTTCQEEFLQAIELPVSAVAFRIIHGRNEVGLCCGNDAPFDE